MAYCLLFSFSHSICLPSSNRAWPGSFVVLFPKVIAIITHVSSNASIHNGILYCYHFSSTDARRFLFCVIIILFRWRHRYRCHHRYRLRISTPYFWSAVIILSSFETISKCIFTWKSSWPEEDLINDYYWYLFNVFFCLWRSSFHSFSFQCLRFFLLNFRSAHNSPTLNFARNENGMLSFVSAIAKAQFR